MMRPGKSGWRWRTWAAAVILLALMLSQSGCIRNAYSDEEASSRNAEASEAIRAFAAEYLPGAEVEMTSILKVSDFAASYLTDIAEGTLQQDGETFQIWLNLKTGDAYRSGGGDEAAQAALALYLAVKGIDEASIVRQDMTAVMLIPSGLETGNIRLDYIDIKGIPFGCEEEKELGENTRDGLLFAVEGELSLADTVSIRDWVDLDSSETLKERYELAERDLTVRTLQDGFEKEWLHHLRESIEYEAYALIRCEDLILHFPVEHISEKPGQDRTETNVREAAEHVTVSVSEDGFEVSFDGSAIERMMIYTPSTSAYIGKHYRMETEEGSVTFVWRQLDSCCVLAREGDPYGYYFRESFTLKAE